MDIDKAFPAFLSKYDETQLADAAGIMKGAIEKEGVLLSLGASRFGLSDHYGNFEKLIDSSLGGITLEITENCNLRCGYCIYNNHFHGARDHGTHNMSEEVAFRAVDYLKHHSHKTDWVGVTFYGGEPLLRFDFIRSCVDYASKVLEGKPVEFNITTNGISMTPQIADYFQRKNFTVLVSIDGPKDIHDRYRKDFQGSGSFDKAISGLKMLADAYGERAVKKIMLSMVYAPPYSGEKIDRIAALWDEFPWLPKNMNVNITYPSEGSIPAGLLPKEEVKEDKDLSMWGSERFFNKYMGFGDEYPISQSMEEKKLARFMQRSIFHEPFDKYHLNGCCVPGVRKLFVAVDGTFRVCEKISSHAPVIGNVFSGMDIDVIKRVYIDDYEKMSLPSCSKCWAIRLCNICYIRAFEDGNLDVGKKSIACSTELNSKIRLLQFFSLLMEQNPGGLDYLYDFQLE